jgi:esterase
MKLFYRKMGAGQPLIILHGLYGSSDNWLSIGRSLADNFEVYLVDQRNHGKSPHADVHNYKALRDDLLEFMDDNGLDKAILAGHSMGGKTVMCFARHFPGRVSSLIVIDIAPKSYKEIARNATPGHYDIIRAMIDMDPSRASSRSEAEAMLADAVPQERIRKFIMKNLGRGEDKKYYWTINTRVLLKELDTIMGDKDDSCFDLKSPVKGFPVLFIRGGKSPYILDEDMDLITKIFPAASFKTIPGAGHWLHAEQPEYFLRVFKDFAKNSPKSNP